MENQAGTNPAVNLRDEFVASFDLKKFSARLQEVISDPLGTWAKVKAEPSEVKQLYLQYLIVMAIVPGLCTFIGLALFGPMPFGAGIKMFLWHVVMTLGGAYLFAMLISAITPTFGGAASVGDALKLLVYSQMPAAAATVLTIIPISFLLLIIWLVVLLAAFYGLYIFWLGIPIILNVPEERKVAFFISLVACALVCGALLSMVGPGMGM